MVKEGDFVAIFHSIHRVMKAEKELKRARLEVLLIPAPRQLTSDCGLAIRFNESVRTEVMSILKAQELEPAEVYKKEKDGFGAVVVEGD